MIEILIRKNNMKIVLQRYIASSAYCSRRKAEELIRAGEVFVNGEIAELGQRVDDGDDVRVKGVRVKAKQEKIYIKLNKPRGYVCTNRDFDAEHNIFELLDKEYKHLHAVGRLDKNSHGLVILTNDGDFTVKMTHPRYEHEKEYLVLIKSEELKIKNKFIADLIYKLKKGLEDKGDILRAKEVEYLGGGKFKIILTQGKKRQIRRMFEALGYKVSDLKRVRIGDIVLGDLRVQEWEVMKNFKY